MILDTSKEKKRFTKKEREKRKAHIIRTIHELTHFTKYKVMLQIHAQNIVFAY